MEEKLTKLYNTLSMISTKGEDTKIMAQCLNYTQMMIVEARNNARGDTEVVEEK